GPFRETLLADATLDELDRRTYSSQWDVPDEIHRKAMEPLRAKWRGKEIQWSYTLEVTFWRSERLLEIATSQRPGGAPANATSASLPRKGSGPGNTRQSGPRPQARALGVA